MACILDSLPVTSMLCGGCPTGSMALAGNPPKRRKIGETSDMPPSKPLLFETPLRLPVVSFRVFQKQKSNGSGPKSRYKRLSSWQHPFILLQDISAWSYHWLQQVHYVIYIIFIVLLHLYTYTYTYIYIYIYTYTYIYIYISVCLINTTLHGPTTSSLKQNICPNHSMQSLLLEEEKWMLMRSVALSGNLGMATELVPASVNLAVVQENIYHWTIKIDRM